MNPQGRRVAITHTDEILNYFGKCGACGYPARAATTRQVYDNGDVETSVLATCSLPCGWSDQVQPTTMTRSPSRA
ncbi:hypothetical protein [Nocardia donostiensis]|uniref:Uncharacterized protein n=1 Tax=Nocardia donostiensis TaxID=1538463 RepID=A0A1W0BJX5_9NOCA|nr:hypothetical protein [Nocardia donostiensis]ONM48909.1 hypothetical protein B0T46_10640 [Nocardia donostiensis]OQS15470.1 hypothetical protein B0T36_09400 [Nocardia donostiensis]OQS22834.1 hypothetical protein B0T44_03825 [Nocardia donostiensis]